MKIFDCIQFFNEIEVVELRMMELGDVVDYFVVVEANKTHTGKPKEFVLEQHLDLYKPWLDRLIYVKVTDLPDYSLDNIWVAENFQRNCIMRGLDGLANPGDKIIVSDADEIPNINTVLAYSAETSWIVLRQQMFYYYVNCKLNQTWRGSVVANYGTFDQPQKLRDFLKLHRYRNERENGGWHYSYLGADPARIRLKAENIAESHNVLHKLGTDEELTAKVASQTDLYSRGGWRQQMQIVDISDDVPRVLSIWLEKYPQFLYGKV